MKKLSLCKDLTVSAKEFCNSDIRGHLNGLPSNLFSLANNLSCFSPYIRSLIINESAWLRDIIDDDIYEVVDRVLDDCKNSDLAGLGSKLRLAKRRSNLLILLADFGKLLKLSDVTKLLSYVAENIVEISINLLVNYEFQKVDPKCFINESTYYPVDVPSAASKSGLLAVAMGKLGAYELNYSSDIDLIFLFDEDRYYPNYYSKIRSVFITVIRKFVKILSENTSEGFVYRVDLRLRPDPSSTPVCIGVLAAQRYYENYGRNWERAAFIKARTLAGDKVAGNIFLKSLSPFIWRKNLDFATIEDIADIRRRIRERSRSSTVSGLPGYNIKTGIGGIREIELFVQTQQLICGGRNKTLRLSQTVVVLEKLVSLNLIKRDTGFKLVNSYQELRNLEHILQLVDDKQTHSLPKDEKEISNIAMMLEMQSIKGFFDHISEIIANVDKTIGELFTKSPFEMEVFDDFNEKELIVEDSLSNYLKRWSGYRALRSERSSKLFAELRPFIISKVQAGGFSSSTLFYFDQFLDSLSGGVQVLSLFKANPSVLKLLIEICGAAPALAEHLSKNPAVLDYVTERSFFDKLPVLRALKAELIKKLEDVIDFEDILDHTRMWVKENQFRTGVHLLKGFSSVEECSKSFSAIAQVCLEILFVKVQRNFESRYGKIPKSDSLILAMGKLGSKEMTLGSDLDLIIIYDSVSETSSNGKVSVPPQVYFARLTQAFISAITVETSKGFLYKVDLRLRPSGKKGPVATSFSSFKYYQINESRVWERLALSRARILNGNTNLKRKVKYTLRKALNVNLVNSTIIDEVVDLKLKIHERDKKNILITDPKYGPGRLQDLELMIQMGGLIEKKFSFVSPFKIIRCLKESGYLSLEEALVCLEAYKCYFTLLQVLNITVATERNGDYPRLTEKIFKNYVKVTPFNDIQQTIDHFAKEINKIFTEKLNQYRDQI